MKQGETSAAFAGFFSNKEQPGKPSPVLPETQDIRQEQQKFWKKVLPRLRKRDRDRIDKVVQDYDAENTIDSLERLVQVYLPTAERAKNDLDDARAAGGRAMSHTVQRFACTFNDFLSSYSQVVTIMNTADAQFGGVAVQTLAILLVVAVNKQRKEDIIEDYLSRFKNDFPRLQDLRNIYATETMQRLIAAVYADVLNFSQQAVEYYQMTTLERLWKAFTEPPQLGVQAAANRIEAELAEVRKEQELLLNKRVQHMEKRLDSLATTAKNQAISLATMAEDTAAIERKVDEIEADLRQIQHNEQQELLAEIGKALVPGGFSFHEHYTEYQTQLQARFRRRFSVSELAAHEQFHRWEHAEGSRVLILQGRTQHAISPLSWLSPAAVELREILSHRDEGETAVVVAYFCRRESMGDYSHIHTVLANLIFQIFTARPGLLNDRNRYQNWSSLVCSRPWREKDLKTASGLFKELLSLIGRVYLILDRPEACKRAEAGLRNLIEVSRRTTCVLKIFLVVDKDSMLSFDVDELREAAGDGALDVIDVPDQ
ncbi:hypothetical protein BDW60DRAFT_210221 [Aspergillus nidulans var. acristatus]